MTIEDIILSHDARGISQLRHYLPADFCTSAGKFILEHRKPSSSVAVIVTGFCIISVKKAETDGPPGAIALSQALHRLGFEVVFVSDKYATPLLVKDTVGNDRVIEFPITSDETSKEYARSLLKELNPAIQVAIERPGFSGDKKFFNMRGIDISDYCAKTDYLFTGRKNTIGIGDGGNELGMGNLSQVIPTVKSLAQRPAVTKVGRTVIASVSNWGAYGVIAALSMLTDIHLLPTVQWEKDLLKELVARGAVDGISGESRLAVDGFGLEENAQILMKLEDYLHRELTGN